MDNRIVLKNEFKDREHFIHILITEIFEKEGFGDLLDNITNVDAESDEGRRIFVEVYDILEFTIRLWNMMEDEENIYVEYTLFEDKEFQEEEE